MADFSKKWEKALPPGFMEKAEAFSADELKKSIVDSNKAISESERDMDSDNDLAVAKERVKELALPYKENIKEATAKSRYCVYLLNERGQS